MRLKTNHVCCAFAWSPASLGTPAMIAMASYSGAMDDDFSDDAHLSICLVDVTLTDETHMPAVGRVRIPDRAHRVDWSPYTGAQGIIAVACGNGHVYIYSATAILKACRGSAKNGEVIDGEAALLWTIREHSGSARGCHFNPSQPNLLATAGDDGKWFVWSLPSPAKTPLASPQRVAAIANSTQPTSISHVQWHPKYAHIVATATISGTVSVWNLKTLTLASTLHVAKASRGAGVACIAWNPVAATLLAVGLDGTHSVVQVWDLKKSMAPVLEMTGHEGGVSGLSWSTLDTSLLASCGADGHTMWWDPETGAKLGELQAESNYVVDVQWCPVLPAVLATSSFEPLFCVATAQDMSGAAKRRADGTPGAMGGVAGGGASASGQPPKWLKERPCGASVNCAGLVASLAPGTTSTIVVTQLRETPMTPGTAMAEGQLRDFARLPAGSPERTQWLQKHQHNLLAAVSAARTARDPIVAYVNSEINAAAAAAAASKNGNDDDPFAELTEEQQKSYEDRAAEMISSGRIAEAVDLCLDNNRFDDAFTVAMLGGGELLAHVRQRYIEFVSTNHPERRHVLAAAAIATGDYQRLINANVPWREALSTILVFVGDGFADACNNLGDALKTRGDYEGAEVCYVCARNVDAVVELYRLQGRSALDVVHNTIILEETAERLSQSPFLAACFCERGLALLRDGHTNDAVTYLQRAARLGSDEAIRAVDHVKFHVPAQLDSTLSKPYEMDPVSDQPSPSCIAFCAMLDATARAQQQQQQQQQLPQQPPPPQQQQQQLRMPSAGPAGGYFPQQQPPAPAHAGYAPPQQQPQQPPPPVSMGAMNPNGTVRPPLIPGGSAAYQDPRAAAPFLPPQQQQQQQIQGSPAPGARPPLISRAGLPQAPNPARASPNPYGTSVPSAASPNAPGAPYAPQQLPLGGAPQPPQQFGPPPPQQQQQQPTLVTGPPKPRLMPHPVSNYSSMSGGASATSVSGSALPPPPPPGGMPPSRAPSAPQATFAPQQLQLQPPQQQPQRMPGQGYSQPPPPRLPSMPAGGYAPPPQSQLQQPPPQGMPSSGYNTPHQQQLQQQQQQMPPAPAMAPPGPPAPPVAPASVLVMSVAHIPSASGQQLVQRLQQIIPHITDPRRRGAVDQAAAQLASQLQRGELSGEIVQALLRYVDVLGTPQAKTVWAEIADRHYDAIRAFHNLRFL